MYIVQYHAWKKTHTISSTQENLILLINVQYIYFLSSLSDCSYMKPRFEKTYYYVDSVTDNTIPLDTWLQHFKAGIEGFGVVLL